MAGTATEHPGAETERWLLHAQTDLDCSRLGLRERFFSHVVLVDRYIERVPGLASLRGEATVMDPYYHATRYPVGVPGGAPFMAFGEEQATAAFEAAEQFLRLASAHIADIT